MTQTLIMVVLFVGAMACLPWLVRRLQQRHAAGQAATGTTSRVLSAVAVGPQQRVITVEVGPEHARTWLVLGVTAQQMTCLHVLPAEPARPAAGVPAAAADAPSFAREVASATHGAGEGRGHA